MQHPGVAEAAVIGVPDELKGEAIVGYAVAKPRRHSGPRARVRHGSGRCWAPPSVRARVAHRGGVAEDAERQDCPPLDPAEVFGRGVGRPLDCGEPGLGQGLPANPGKLKRSHENIPAKTGSKRQAALSAAGPAESESAGTIACPTEQPSCNQSGGARHTA